MVAGIDQGLEDVEGAVLLQGEGGQVGQGREGCGQMDGRGSFYRDPTTLGYQNSELHQHLYVDQQYTEYTDTTWKILLCYHISVMYNVG